MNPLMIGNVTFTNPFFAAPLAGITDKATRRTFKSMGASLVFSEMISAKGLLYENRNTRRLLAIDPEEMPLAYQIFGKEPEIIAEIAEKLRPRSNVILDINMGCPVPKVVKNGEGAALLKDSRRIYDLVKSAVQYSGKPVTCKIRTGWDEDHITALENAAAIEEAGAAAVTIHGRTRQQFYQGQADWEIIKAVKEKAAIPVIGNGDVFSAEIGLKRLEQGYCDFLMIGRGMLGNPWIFRELNALWSQGKTLEPPTGKEKVQMMKDHLLMMVQDKDEVTACKEMRKHGSWYIKGLRGAATLRREMNEATTVEQWLKLIEQVR